MQGIFISVHFALWVLHYIQDFLYCTSVFSMKKPLSQGDSQLVLTVHPAILLTFDPGLCAEELDSV